LTPIFKGTKSLLLPGRGKWKVWFLPNSCAKIIPALTNVNLEMAATQGDSGSVEPACRAEAWRRWAARKNRRTAPTPKIL
jgi:hypothetical protein